MDFGCLAPVRAFTELFRRHGVTATAEEVRGPMGMHKRDHIRAMLRMPALAQRWTEAHGAPPSEALVEELFQAFLPVQIEVIRQHTDVIPGTVNTFHALRARGIRVGTTTGYSSAMMQICLDAARAAGYEPEANVAADEVPNGRPEPWMAVKAAAQLGDFPREACVKVGDTVADVLEGINAGMWSVAVVDTGNEVGLSQAELEALPPDRRKELVRAAQRKLVNAAAHYVIPGVAELPSLITTIEERLRIRDRP
ncbi:MAG: phosphonoacetaldehyde hydrolase [Candidatus Hydrogenedentes bacterium]|nr:phosphonoacetaldehyde hydrolase [Candidatus Hydrogenedentota bacterium]